MRRSVLVQLVAFVVIGVAATVYGVRYVAGPQSFGGAIDVTVRAADAFGVDAGTAVTYRGVPVGHVTAVTLDRPDHPVPDGAGGRWDGRPVMSIDLALDPGTTIPASATARVVGASALGIRTVDIADPGPDAGPEPGAGPDAGPEPGAEPDAGEGSARSGPGTSAGGGPFLQDGDVIRAPASEEPVPLGDLLADVSGLLDGIDPDAVRSLGRTIGTALDGTGPELRGLIDDVDRISAMLDGHSATLASLTDDALPVLRALAANADDFPEAVRAGRDIADQLAGRTDTLTHLFDASPAAIRRANRLLTGSRGDIGALLAGADTITGIIGARDASLGAGLTAIPRALRDLASIVHGGRADFVLVATQGPACYYPTQRRAVGDTAPRPPVLDLYCPPGENLEQRGSRNAPRPDDLGLRGATGAGTPIGPQMAADPLLIPTGEQMLRRMQEGDGS